MLETLLYLVVFMFVFAVPTGLIIGTAVYNLRTYHPNTPQWLAHTLRLGMCILAVALLVPMARLNILTLYAIVGYVVGGLNFYFVRKHGLKIKEEWEKRLKESTQSGNDRTQRGNCE